MRERQRETERDTLPHVNNRRRRSLAATLSTATINSPLKILHSNSAYGEKQETNSTFFAQLPSLRQVHFKPHVHLWRRPDYNTNSFLFRLRNMAFFTARSVIQNWRKLWQDFITLSSSSAIAGHAYPLTKKPLSFMQMNITATVGNHNPTANSKEKFRHKSRHSARWYMCTVSKGQLLKQYRITVHSCRRLLFFSSVWTTTKLETQVKCSLLAEARMEHYCHWMAWTVRWMSEFLGISIEQL